MVVARIGLTVLAAMAVVPALAQKGVLDIGSPAPSLKGGHWIKGTPWGKYEKGRVYVVEFWATWCGPCKEAMPHLSELARTYRGQADIIGVDVMEFPEPHEDPSASVEKFIHQEGDQMDFPVTMDGRDNRLSNVWLKSAGEIGIPTTFIVGKDGRIAWIGHPESGLNEVLKAVVEDHFDTKRAYEERERESGPFRAVQHALNDKNYQLALEKIDEITTKNAEQAPIYAAFRLQAIVHTNPNRFETEARKLLSERSNSMGAYNLLCALLLDEPNLSNPINQFGLTLALEGSKLKERQAMFLSFAVDFDLRLGNKTEALRLAKATAEAAESDPNCGQSFRDRARERVKELDQS